MPGSGSYRARDREIRACRTCKAPIFFVRLHPSGKALPVDERPSEAGNIVLMHDDSRDAVTLGPEEAAAYKRGKKFVTHFVTCPDAKFWRKARGIPEPVGGKPAEMAHVIAPGEPLVPEEEHRG